VTDFLAARDSAMCADKRALAILLERGDVDEISARVVRLLARSDAAATGALSLLDDSKALAPLAEALLALAVLKTPYIERLVARIGLAGAKALWAARIRRPSTHARRMKFVGWIRAIGQPGEELIRVLLPELVRRATTPGQIDCIEDLLLALPQTLGPRLASAVEPLLGSASPRIRELAEAALARS
jgi:hypothetical protein